MATVITFTTPTILRNVATPVQPSDAGPKAYIDTQAGGSTYFTVTTRTGPLSVYLSAPGQFTVVGRSGNIVVPVQ
jgi:hypothetical protein